MDYQDYYETLGVSKTATDEEIKSAYRRLAKQYHPDHNRGNKAAEEKFKAINEAYEVLKDKEKRARYDQLGASYNQWEQSGGNSTNFNWGDWFSGTPGGGFTNVDFGGGGGGFSDFFSQIFGGMAGNARPGGYQRSRVRVNEQTPAAQEFEVAITLEEAFHGTRRIIQAGGQKLEASIPAGAKNGSKIRLPRALQGTRDLILKVSVPEKEGAFERKEDDLYVDVPLDLYTAVLGGEAVVSAMDGTFALKIPAGTQPDQMIRLSGKGMPKLNQKGARGDLYARMRVRVPKNLSPKQKQLFEELRNDE